MPDLQKTAWQILVVDDEPLVRDSIRRMLAFDGHKVDTAASGVEALKIFKPEKYHLVIVDFEMPDMKGDTLALALKAADPKQPILMITAYIEWIKLADDPNSGVNAVMTKPFNLQELRETTARLVASR